MNQILFLLCFISALVALAIILVGIWAARFADEVDRYIQGD